MFERVLSVVLVAGCGPVLACVIPTAEGDSDDANTETDDPGEFEALTDHAAWIAVEASDDPLAAHRPDEVVCGPAGWYVEGKILEIDTNYCNYLAVAQPSLAAVSEGRAIRLGFYHFNLTAIDPALAHVALLIDGSIVWEREVEIPGSAAVYELEFEAPISAPIGSEVMFHLHNHGQNTWALQSISAQQ